MEEDGGRGKEGKVGSKSQEARCAFRVDAAFYDTALLFKRGYFSLDLGKFLFGVEEIP